MSPHRNRVTPTGEIVAVPLRGEWTGNRGILHRGEQVVRFHAHEHWLTCALRFRDRWHEQWQPHHFTWLYFRDEAVSLAAGHRPCAECRRVSYNDFRSAWADDLRGEPPSAKAIDHQLHGERIVRGNTRAAFTTSDGATFRTGRSWPWIQGRRSCSPRSWWPGISTATVPGSLVHGEVSRWRSRLRRRLLCCAPATPSRSTIPSATPGVQSSPIPATRSSLHSLPEAERALLRPARAPTHAGAMKAMLTQERFSDDGWIFERKLDGVRCVAIRDGGAVALLSRNDLSLNERYPEVAEALDERPRRSSRSTERWWRSTARRRASRSWLSAGTRRAGLLLHLRRARGSRAATPGSALRTRKRLLRDVVHFDAKALRFPSTATATGEESSARRAARAGRGSSPNAPTAPTPIALEGLAEAQVRAGPGARDRWLHRTAGLADGLRRVAARLLRRRRAPVRGQGGHGLRRSDAAVAWQAATGSARRDTPPFAGAASIRERTAQWVRPELVAELGFSEWTTAGRLRHPRFLGLRDDKPAREVVREAPGRS